MYAKLFLDSSVSCTLRRICCVWGQRWGSLQGYWSGCVALLLQDQLSRGVGCGKLVGLLAESGHSFEDGLFKYSMKHMCFMIVRSPVCIDTYICSILLSFLFFYLDLPLVYLSVQLPPPACESVLSCIWIPSTKYAKTYFPLICLQMEAKNTVTILKSSIES